jgi:hypothetical protein
MLSELKLNGSLTRLTEIYRRDTSCCHPVSLQLQMQRRLPKDLLIIPGSECKLQKDISAGAGNILDYQF